MKVETRGETEEVAEYVYDRAVQVLEGAALMYDLGLSISKQGEANTANSSPELARLIALAAKGVEGVTAVSDSGGMEGSDDACWLMKRVQDRGGQATYAGIGADIAAGHHNSCFDFDEKALPIAASVLYHTIQGIMARSGAS
jgi:aminobenzoyl-glutamate utilization protein A